MNPNSTTKPKDTICSRCHSKNNIFLHHIWDEKKRHKMCTSCVLQSHKSLYCPTCFVIHDSISKEMSISCNHCPSRSHVGCFSHKESSSGASSMCATCLEPKRIVFRLRKKNLKGENGYRKVVDMKAAGLLLTAAKIGKNLLSSAHDEIEDYGLSLVLEAHKEKKRVMEDVATYVGPPLVDSESGKLVRLSIEGEADI